MEKQAKMHDKVKNNLPVKLLLCDLDGTMLDNDSKITRENSEAVLKLKQAGVNITLATGRMDGMIRVYMHQLDIRLPAIACNGAIIRDCTTEEIIRSFPLYEADYWFMTDYMLAAGQDFLCYTADAVYYPEYSQTISRFYAYNQMSEKEGIQTIPLYPLEKFREEIPAQVVKIMTHLSASREYDRMWQYFTENCRCTIVQSMDEMADIMRRGVSKGSAMRHLAEILQIDLASIAAIGDQENDIEMIAAAGMGIAMGNAIDQVKHVADAVTADNENSGVARAIYDYII